MSYKPSISVFCRIRPPTQYEQMTSPSHTTLTKRPDISRSKSPLNSPNQTKSSSNLSNHMYSIFSCPNEKSPEIVICSENPIKGKLIETNLLYERDLPDYQNSILDKAIFFQFDRVLPSNSTQNLVFSEICKEKVHNLLLGLNSTILFYGPNSSGKSFTMRGGENKEAGVMIQTIENLLNLIEISQQAKLPANTTMTSRRNSQEYRVYCSIFAVQGKEIYDLIALKGKKISIEEKDEYEINLQGITVYPIRFLSEFKNFYRIALNNLKNLGTKKTEFSKSSSNIIVSFSVKKIEVLNQEPSREIHLAKLNFVKLADSDNLEKEEDFHFLSKYLVQCSEKKTSDIYKQNALTYSLRDTMNEKTSIAFVCLVSGSPTIFSPCLQALKFSQKLSEKLQRKDKSDKQSYHGIENPETSSLFLEIKHFYKQIFNFSQISKDFTYNDCLDWLNDKDYKLFSLEKRLKKVKTPCQELSDNQLILSETKNFLQSLKTRFLEMNEENKDFNNLYSQYKRTKKSLETTDRPTRFSSELPESMKKSPNFAEDLGKEINNLKKTIMNKIDEAILVSPERSTKGNKFNKNNDSNRTENKEILLDKKAKTNLEVDERKREIENNDPNIKDEKAYWYKMKLGKKDEKILELKEEIQRNKIKFTDERNKLIQENTHLREMIDQNSKMLNEFNNDLDQRKPNHEYLYKLEDNQAFQSQLIQDLRAQVLEKTDENDKISKDFDNKLKEKEETNHLEIRRIKEENQDIKKIVSEMKQKNKLLFEENKAFVQEIAYHKENLYKFQEEKENINKILNENFEEIGFLKKELERTRDLKEEISTHFENNSEKIKSYEFEIEELMKKLEQLSEEKDSIERMELHDQEIIKNLEKNNLCLLDETQYQRDYIKKLESQLNFLKTQQNQNFDALESKIADYLFNMEKLSEDNEELLLKEKTLKNECEILLQEKKKGDEQYRELYEKYEELRMHLTQFDENVKEFTMEKKNEIKDLNLSYDQEKSLAPPYESALLEKLKLLENIQTSIKIQRSSEKKPKFNKKEEIHSN